MNISSGAAVPEDIESDLLTAEMKGKAARDAFVELRLQKGDGFFDPIKRLKLKTMGHLNKATMVKTTENKIVE